MDKTPDIKKLQVPASQKIEKSWERDGNTCALLSSADLNRRRLSGQICYGAEQWTEDADDRYSCFIKNVLYVHKLTKNNSLNLIRLIFNDAHVPLRPWVNHVGWMFNEVDRLARLISWARKTNEPMIGCPPTTTLEKAKIRSGDGRTSGTCGLITPVGLALVVQAAGFFEGKVSETYAEFFAINFNKNVLVPYWREDTACYEMMVDKTLEEIAEYSGEQVIHLEKLALEFDPVPLSP